ncbi:MAG: type IV toxin-antitoxin system AbiEi family antitoxin domain-containing protein [Acidiferrobacterales bacterium]
MTTKTPFEVWIAIGNKEHPPQLDYPPLRTVHFGNAALTAGMETRPTEWVKVRVTCVAKTATDCFKFRNKIGLSACAGPS